MMKTNNKIMKYHSNRQLKCVNVLMYLVVLAGLVKGGCPWLLGVDTYLALTLPPAPVPPTAPS